MKKDITFIIINAIMIFIFGIFAWVTLFYLSRNAYAASIATIAISMVASIDINLNRNKRK